MDVLKRKALELRSDMERQLYAEEMNQSILTSSSSSSSSSSPRPEVAPSEIEFDFDVSPSASAMSMTDKTQLRHKQDEGRIDALTHENDFLKNKIREASELVQKREQEFADMQRSAKSRIWDQKENIRYLNARVQELESQNMDIRGGGGEKCLAEYEALLHDMQQREEATEAARQALEHSSTAHLNTQEQLSRAMHGIEDLQAQLKQRDQQVQSLGAEVSRLALQQAGSTAILKAKEAAFCQQQLQRVQTRMREQENELQATHSMQAAVYAAVHTSERALEEKEQLLVAALAANAQLESVFRQQLAEKDACISSIRGNNSDDSKCGRDVEHGGGVDEGEDKDEENVTVPPPVVSSSFDHRSKRPRSPYRMDSHHTSPLCSTCKEAAYGMMTICRSCNAHYHSHCYASLGTDEQCSDCHFTNAKKEIR